MKSFLLILLFFTFSIFTVYSQQDTTYSFGYEEEDIQYFFGFNLIPNAMGGLFHIAIIKPEKDGTYKKVRQLTVERFISQASGKEESLANPRNVDLFKKYQIQNPNVINELWKLRYLEYPYLSTDKPEEGWSTNDSIPYLPSETQMKTLEKFGMFRLNDYIYGENAFRLLQFMEKPDWIKLYKESF